MGRKATIKVKEEELKVKKTRKTKKVEEEKSVVEEPKKKDTINLEDKIKENTENIFLLSNVLNEIISIMQTNNNAISERINNLNSRLKKLEIKIYSGNI